MPVAKYGAGPTNYSKVWPPTQSAFPVCQLVPNSSIRPPEDIHPLCTFSHRLQRSTSASPPPTSVSHERKADAYFSTVAGCDCFPTRTGPLIRYTSLPQGSLILEAIRAKRAQISGRETATTRRNSPGLHRHGILPASPQLSGCGKGFPILRKVPLGCRRGEILFLSQFHAHLHRGPFLAPQFPKSILQKKSRLQK